jgi:glycosyltransferase involved in cell wall biosynthesis
MFLIGGLELAGPELRLLAFARGFPVDVEVHVVVLGHLVPLLDEFRDTPAKVVQIPVGRALTDWGQVRRVVAYAREHRIDVVNSFDLKTLIVAVAAKARFGRRLTAVHHLVSLWDDIGPRHALLLRQGMRRMDHLLCNGRAVRDVIVGDRPVRAGVTVIPNGVDTDHFAPSAALRREQRERFGLAPGDFVVGTVANFRPVKNYPLLLRAVARVAERHPRLRLLCVGSGVLLDETRALATSLGIADRVTFAGSMRDVRAPLAALDAFVLASTKEGNPNVVLQAMAMGVPAVGSAVGEIPYHLDDGRAGLLFAPSDEAGLAAALERLASDRVAAAELGAAGRRRALSEYALPRMLQSYVDFYRQVEPR